MKKIKFCLGSLIAVFGGVSLGATSLPALGDIALHQCIFPALFIIAGVLLSYFSARSIGEDRARGIYKLQGELQSGIYIVERGDKRFVILARNILMPGEGEELYRLDEPIEEDVFAIHATRDGDTVSIEPYRGEPQTTSL